MRIIQLCRKSSVSCIKTPVNTLAFPDVISVVHEISRLLIPATFPRDLKKFGIGKISDLKQSDFKSLLTSLLLLPT